MDVRPSPISGSWYSADPIILKQTIEAYLAEIPTQTAPGRITGVIAPHAGHMYSGALAARAISQFRGLTPDVVAILAPLHKPYPGQVFSTDHSAYETPLGTIPINDEILRQVEFLLEKADLSLTRLRRDREHALEIELPFLQCVLKQPFQLLPLMIADQSIPTCRKLGNALAEVLQGRDALLVGSTDLSHFYPANVARKYDEEMLARIHAFDPEAIISAEVEQVGFACGRGAVAATLWAARGLGANHVQILGYSHSGQVSGDISSVVGYGAAVIYAGVTEVA